MHRCRGARHPRYLSSTLRMSIAPRRYIAVGMLLTALHLSGLAALTHTPSPMRFLSEVLRRPRNEKAFAVIPVGYPAQDCEVPDLVRKTFEQVLVEV